MTKRGRGRPPTGCPQWDADEQVWIARVLTPTGGRKPVRMPGIAEHETDRAAAKARQIAERTIDGGFVPEGVATDTVNEWFSRYYLAATKGEVGRKNRGAPQVTALERERKFLHWISPIIGTKSMVTIGPNDLRAVVRKLDDAIRTRLRFYETATPEQARRTGHKPGISAKAARNIWGECTNAFREACSSKIETLRVRDDDPTRGVQPPLMTDAREQAALYPSELLALLSAPADKVPTYRRILYAVAAYTGLRAGELRGLVPEAVDFEHGVLNVRRQSRAGKLARTKTAAGRRQVPIEAELAPLLEVLVDLAADGEPLLRIPPPEDCAELVRKDLIAAGCDREELFADDAERHHFTFHGLRHTCLTHWAVAGKGVQFLSAAGHTDLATTQGYVDVALMVSGGFGQPHPPIPGNLVAEAASVSWRNPVRNTVSNTVSGDANYAELLRPQRELNPCYRRERPVS
jgi:integrase